MREPFREVIPRKNLRAILAGFPYPFTSSLEYKHARERVCSPAVLTASV